MRTLTELYSMPGIMLTAHRGASFEDAENTFSAFRTAVEAGADMIEFDVRMTRDGVPVILHDQTVDRTSEGTGRPEDHTLAELKAWNFTMFSKGERRAEPLHPGESIPTFEEVLAEFHEQIAMNIQVYADPAGVEEICRLYLRYGMPDRAYLTIADIAVAEMVRRISPAINICLTPGWAERALPEKLKLCSDFGCRFVQPVHNTVTPETFKTCCDLGLRANVFFADTAADALKLMDMGASGFLTNRIREMRQAFPAASN